MEFPNPDEEFELMHAEELEALHDFGDPGYDQPAKKSKKSLDFSCAKNKSNQTNNSPVISKDSQVPFVQQEFDVDLDDLEELMNEPSVPTLPEITQTQPPLSEISNFRKRKAPEEDNDVDDHFGEIQNALNFSDRRKRPNTDNITDEFIDTAEFDLGQRNKIAIDDHSLIERIKFQRQKFIQQMCPDPSSRSEKKQDEDYFSNRLPTYPFITMRNFDSKKYYLRIRSEHYVNDQYNSVKAARNLHLLNKDTWREAKSILEEQKKMLELKQKLDFIDEGSWAGVGREENGNLWVEKYSPKTYKDLLSDEGTNKTLLKWLKFWDPIVFNKKIPKKTAPTPGKYKEIKWKNKQKILTEEFDSHGRPIQKVVLLCGPPGLGKTTLAHIAAKHAGYNPVEVNASDDSNPEAFRIQLEAATQMKSVIGDDPKPNCLILDEIDGSQASAVDVLLQFISDKQPGKGKKKGSKPRILKRPIICICNDLYSLSLRNLRQVSLIINFPPTTSTRLSARLMEICQNENMKCDMGALFLLCEKTNNDIRSCLSFLHFYQTRGKEVHANDVQRANVGQKDTHKGLFVVWQEIFQIFVPKNGSHKMVNNNKNDKIDFNSRMYRTLHTVQRYGDYERLSQGVYENYLRMKMRETRFQGASLGMEWFCYFDYINSTIKETQSYYLMPYMPYCFAMWHFLFAGFSYPVLQYPQKSYESTVKTNHNQVILNSVLRGMDPHTRSGTKANEILMDVLPFILHVISPSLKNSNTHLFTIKEKEEVSRVVNIFIEFGLVYVQERTGDGDMIFRIEPNISELVQFTDLTTSISATYAVKQVIAHEIEAEKIRRISGAWREETASVPTPTSKKLSQEILPNHLQSLSPQILKPQKLPKVVGLKNWLSITKKKNNDSAQQQQITQDEMLLCNDLNEISFNYKEGFSNAVRKNVKISHLL